MAPRRVALGSTLSHEGISFFTLTLAANPSSQRAFDLISPLRAVAKVGYPGEDPSLALFTFLFLVALGVDYNIFLMARVREETLRCGTREGVVRALEVRGLVRTILVPALVIELDRRVWWPSALAARARRWTGLAIEA